MKLEQSQLDYLKERSSNYDRKYRMFEILLDKLPNTLNNTIELFGGVGIESYYLQCAKKINNHISIDKDEKCNEIERKMLPMVSRINIDCFKYSFVNKVDLLVCDSVFNNKEFDNIVNLVNKFDFDNLILTNTGVFNVRFNKGLSYDDYWNKLISRLSKCGLYVSYVIYSSDFGMMLIKKHNCISEIHKLENKDISLKWRLYVKEITK